jgi:hypothetical protein
MSRHTYTHIVEQLFKPRSKMLLRETWRNKRGRFDRLNGPAILEYDAVINDVVRELWYRNGVLHREAGPAILEHLPGRGITKESWWKNGMCGRDDHPLRRGSYRRTSAGPAIIEYDPRTHKRTREEWRTLPDGHLHRSQGPAVIERDAESGAVTKALWYRNGREIAVRAAKRRAFLTLAAAAKSPHP